MSANSPTLSPSQAETTSPPNSRDDSSEQHDDAPTSISPLVTGDDTTDHHPVPEPPQQQQTQQQQQGASSSSPTIPSTARTEIVDSSESVVESLQRPVVNVAPVASVAQTPTTATATPVDNIVPPATTAPAMRELTPSPEMRKPSSPPSIGPSGAALSITLLLISGVRHQFTMDETYLEQHSVKTQSGKEPLKDPFEMSVGQLKECIWKDWKDGMIWFPRYLFWEARTGVLEFVPDLWGLSRMGSKTR